MQDSIQLLYVEFSNAPSELKFRPVFDEYAPRLYGYFLKRLKDQGLAQDLTQEVMTKVWSRPDLFNPKRASLRTWIYRIARNRLIDHGRKVSRIAQHADEAMNLAFSYSEHSIEESIELGERVDELRAGVDALPPKQADVIRSAYLGGRSLSECAVELGIPLGTAKTRARLALAKLRRQLSTRGHRDVHATP